MLIITEREKQTILQALQISIGVLENDKKLMHETGQQRIAEQFIRQIEDVKKLHDRLEFTSVD